MTDSLCVQASAAQALLKMDGFPMGHKVLSVAISNPPARSEQPADVSSTFVPSLGGGGKKDTAGYV